jgi:hypothetical protein
MPLKMATKSNLFLGRWRVVEMELWEIVPVLIRARFVLEEGVT